MTVGAIGSTISPYYTQQTNAASNPFAQFFSNLQTLQQQDPAKLKSVLSDIADKLNAAAQQASGPEAQKLSALAAKYEQAAQTGDISQLRAGHRGHRHGHHAAQASSGTPDASSTSSASTTSGATSSQPPNLQSLFASILQEVSSAASGS